MIMPFVDPVTREKVKFNPKIIEEGYFTSDMTMKEWWGGDQDFEYNHERYWPNLVEMCAERSNAWMENWQKLGGKIGISEWDYKKGSENAAKAVEVAEKQAEEVSNEEVIAAAGDSEKQEMVVDVQDVEAVPIAA